MKNRIALLGLMLMLAGTQPAVRAQAAADKPAAPATPVLTVTGRGEIEIDPDQVSVNLGVMAGGANAEDVQKKINESMQAALEKFKGLGIAEKDIRTSRLTMTPVYEPMSSAAGNLENAPRIIGYRANNMVTVQTGDFSLVSKIIDAGIAAGVNQLSSVTFQLKKDTDARKAALKDAVAQAREKAQSISAAMGVTLGEVAEITESGVNVSRPIVALSGYGARGGGGGGRGGAGGGGADGGIGTQVQAGQVNVSASVSITYKISPAAK